MNNTKSKKKYPFVNPVIEIYRGYEVRKYNRIDIRVNPFEYKKMIDAKIDLGLSGKDVIEKRILFPCNQQVIIPAKPQYAKSD